MESCDTADPGPADSRVSGVGAATSEALLASHCLVRRDSVSAEGKVCLSATGCSTHAQSM